MNFTYVTSISCGFFKLTIDSSTSSPLSRTNNSVRTLPCRLTRMWENSEVVSNSMFRPGLAARAGPAAKSGPLAPATTARAASRSKRRRRGWLARQCG